MIFADCCFIVLMTYCYDRPRDEQGRVARDAKIALHPISAYRRTGARLSSSTSMKHIKLSGREQAVLRAIDYTSGSTGDEIRETTHIEADELTDILNGLCDVGYVEVFPYAEKVTFLSYANSRFEQNPSYALELKAALRRS